MSDPLQPAPTTFRSRLFPGADRAAALAALEQFAPEAGEYGSQRNYARPGAVGVSRLSPYLSARILTEEQVCRRMLLDCPYNSVEKYIQEVCWRTYWKGWLEQRPGIWRDYRRDLEALKTHGALPKGLNRVYTQATEGRTGIDCFDTWVNDLRNDNYLHNHVRMWFASIWIFTLQLPWHLGADFFWRHLLDADAASNTLSWRWVAGLQTVGKHYLARAENIHQFTGAQFNPEGELNENAEALSENAPLPKPNLTLPVAPIPALPADRVGLLLHGDDLLPEISPLAGVAVGHICGGVNHVIEPEWRESPAINNFQDNAFHDARDRATAHFNASAISPDSEHWTKSVLEWARSADLEIIHTLHAPVGPWADALSSLERALPATTRLVRTVRPWDAELWPHAKAGFFKFRQKIPGIIEQLL